MEYTDSSWKSLYRLGSVAALLYLITAIGVPMVLVVALDYDFTLSGAELLPFIAAHRTWWIALQGLVLGPSAIAIVTYLALYVALRDLDKSLAAIAAVITVGSQILFQAYFPVVTGLVYLSDQYAAAASAAQRDALVGGAEALVAMNNAYGPSDTMVAVGVLLYSLVMLKGRFHKAVAYFGVATFVAAVVGALLKPVIGAAYLWWWVFFVVRFAAVMVKRYSLGWRADKQGAK